nr:zinc ribbon domain-containing protein [uncultured Mediterraneibacter sp.]
MKDFFEDLGKRIGETAETMTNKAGDAIEIQRLKSQIRGLARGNAADLMELGRTIYDRYKAGEEVEENTKGLCDAIKNREVSIEEYEKKIARIKGASECSNCGKMVAKDMAFCPYCGEKIEAVREETEVSDETERAEETAAEEESKESADETTDDQ